MLTAFWWAWAAFFGAMTLYLILLWDAGRPSLALALAAALLVGALGTGVAGRAERLLRLRRHRRQRLLDLRDPSELHTWPTFYERFQLAPNIWLEPNSGRLLLENARRTERVLEFPGEVYLRLALEDAREDHHSGLALQFWGDRPERGTLLFEARLEIYAACLPSLYWAAWRLCQEKGWSLSAPFGSQPTRSLERPLRQRLENQQRWTEGAAVELEGEIPFLVEETATGALYRFPMHEASPELGAALQHWSVDQDRWLRHLALWSALGLITAPLTAVALWLRARLTDHCEVELRVEGDKLYLGEDAEPLEDLLHVSLLPVHPGPPVLLTQTRAVLLGGLTQYEDRVRCGRHILGQLLRHLPQEGESAATEARSGAGRTRPGGASAFLGQRWSWQPPAPAEPNKLRLLFAPVLATLTLLGLAAGWAAWRPWGSAAQVFYDAPWWRLGEEPEVLLIGLALCTAGAWMANQRTAPQGSNTAWASLCVAACALLSLAAPATLGPYDQDQARLLDLSGVDASGRDLRGLNMEAMRLNSATFKGADLRGADFTNANLWEANLNGADLREATFQETYMQGADLRGADLRDATMQGASLVKAQLLHTNLSGAWLVNADLFGTEITDTDMSGADLTGAELKRSELTRVDLSGASLTKANLREAELNHCDLTRARFQSDYGEADVEGLIIGLDTVCVDGEADIERSVKDCLEIKPIFGVRIMEPTFPQDTTPPEEGP
jgi:uncharacterized protein YjbI with pentapeptide repeats